MAELVWAHDFAVLIWSNSPVVSRSLSPIWGFAFPLAQWIQTALLPLDAPLSNFTSKVPVLYVLFARKTWAEHLLQSDIRSYQSSQCLLGTSISPSVGTILDRWFSRQWQDPSPEGDRLFGQEFAACRCQWESRSLLHDAAGRSGFWWILGCERFES